MTAQLVRDLAQVVSPAGIDAPLRGPSLGELDVVENGYVLCRNGRVEAVGPMGALGRLEGDVTEVDGRGRVAVPGLVDCHTHASIAGDRAREFELSSRGASDE